ncbi:MAG: hypothetical protein NTZ61_00335 [Proteobacteria bacterium]|nr:hypothetical protein [Pseudomonadota bacterium]
MKRIVVIASSIAVLSVAAAQAAPDGVPARPRSIGNWTQHDPEKPIGGAEAWTPSDVAGFLQLYPDAFFILGYDDAKPPGITNWKRRATQLAELERIAAARGVDVSGRLCMSERPDVLTRLIDATSPCSPTNGGGGCDWEGDMDGSLGEAETVIKASGLATAGKPDSLVDARADWQPNLWYKRLVVLRPGGPGEERHRVVANDRTGLTPDAPWRIPPRTGDRYEVRGSFDPRWVRQVPKRVHEDTVRRFWAEARDVCGAVPCARPAMPLDPFATANTRGFVAWVERKAIEALRTDSTVPALYGSGYPDKQVTASGDRPAGWNDPYFFASGVILDVSNPAYRAWRVRYLLYKLADHGIEPGESTCLSMAYKPGWHTYYDEQTLGPVTGDPCSVSGIHEYTGPAHVCQDGTSHGGPFNPTPFGPGEFEEAISNYFRETIATLTASGYKDLRIITSEAPGIRGTTWLILDDDVRRNPKMLGELGSWIEPRLAALASLPPPIAKQSTPAVEDSTEPAATPSDTSSSAGTASTGNPVGATTASGGSASSFSLGSGPKTGASAGTKCPTDTRYPGTSTTTPVAVEVSQGVSSPIAGSGADRGTRSALPASERRENVARSKPARPGYVTKGSRGGGGTIYAPTFDK